MSAAAFWVQPVFELALGVEQALHDGPNQHQQGVQTGLFCVWTTQVSNLALFAFSLWLGAAVSDSL